MEETVQHILCNLYMSWTNTFNPQPMTWIHSIVPTITRWLLRYTKRIMFLSTQLLVSVAFYAPMSGLVVGIMDTIRLRDANNHPGITPSVDFGSPNRETFDQLVAIILLTLPFLALLDAKSWHANCLGNDEQNQQFN